MTFYLVRVGILLCLLCIIGISPKCQCRMSIDWLHGLVTHHQSNLKFAEILFNRWRLLFFLPPFTSFIYSQHKVILFSNFSWSFGICYIYLKELTHKNCKPIFTICYLHTLLFNTLLFKQLNWNMFVNNTKHCFILYNLI